MPHAYRIKLVMPSPTPINGNVLAFDFGLKHIGVALGNTFLQTARPLTRLKAVDGIPQWTSIENLINEWDIQAFIVGKPLNKDGNTQDIYFSAKKFSQRLAGRFNRPVFLVDERYTTKEAKILNKKALEYDSLSAKIILESWLRGLHNDQEV